MGVTRPPPSQSPRRRRIAQAKALAAAAEPSQLARPASAQSRRAVESGRQQVWAWVDACPAYWRFRGLEPAAESTVACSTDTACDERARTPRQRVGVLKALLWALRIIPSNYIIQRLVGTYDPEIVWHAHTANSEQARGSGPRGRAGCAAALRRGRFSLEVRQPHRPLEEPIDLLLPLGTERRRRGGRALRSQLRRGRGRGHGGTARPMARPTTRPMLRPVARPSSQG